MKDHPEVYSRMIAAYVIGNPVTQASLDNNPHLKFATGPDDTGVIISYNTEAPNVMEKTYLFSGRAQGLRQMWPELNARHSRKKPG